MSVRQRHRRFARALLGASIALTAVVCGLMPPASQVVPPPPWSATRPTVRGAYHIHSNRSDGAGTLDDIAAAASRAGLQFVIVTDHGDGTRPPLAPSYRSGVLCLDAVELNTDQGHYVALGLKQTPFPFAGSAASVVEDVARMGGVGFAAHPDSARASLRWRAWDVGFDGLEWLNIDSEWRDEGWSALARAGLTYWFRSPESVASILDRPSDLIERWDRATQSRRVPVLAAADAHARLGTRTESASDGDGWSLPIPTYEASFRAFSNHIVLEQPLSGDAVADEERLLNAIRQGRTFTVVEGIAAPAAFEFVVQSGDQAASIGDDVALRAGTEVRARVSAPAGASLVVLRNGVAVAQTTGPEAAIRVTDPGAYRVEVTLPGHSLPWLFSNPIYVGFDRQPTTVQQWPPAVSQATVNMEDVRGEASPGSLNEFQATRDLSWRFRLAGGAPAGQYAAVRLPAAGLNPFTRVRFDVEANRPMRVWVQLRRPAGTGERWGRTVFADQQERTVELDLATLRPIGPVSTSSAPLGEVDSLLFVVDTVNTAPGSEGRVRLSNVAFVR